MRRNVLNVKILKKSQIIISIIALMLITAGYFNYIDNMESIETASNNISEVDEFAAIGDAKLVDAEAELEPEPESHEEINNENKNEEIVSTGTENIEDYFASSRLERNTIYSEMISTYERMIENPNVSETQKGIATNEIYAINSTKNAIMICENLIKNKGFEDVIIFSNNNSINVIVKATSLQTQAIAQIQNIISRELNAEIQNIHISYK